MTPIANRSRQHASLVAFTLGALLVLASCAGKTGEPKSSVDLAPFKAMAKGGGCADIRNRLFLIDDKLVFWDTQGNCADAAYDQTLYGSAPDQILCTFHDSIAGPVNKCQDEQYRNLFDTMVANLDKADLGLGSGHTVQQISF